MAEPKKPDTLDDEEKITVKRKFKAEKAEGDVENLQVKDSTAPDSEEPDKTTDPESSDEDLQTAMADAEVGPEPENSNEDPAKPKLKKHSKKKKWLISGAIVVAVIAILMAIPVTRYAILGIFISKDVTFSVTDSKTNKPVSGVEVSIAGKSATSDAKGNATVKGVPVGDKSLTAKKKHYQDLKSNVLVPIFDRKESARLSVVATGRQVPVTVLNKISGKPIEKAVVTVDHSTSTTNEKGEVTVVLPADKATQEATITLDGYNTTTATIQVTEQVDPKNTFTLVPSGKIHFLSKRTGKINVMKSNLDGSNPEVVLAGTGKEDEHNTILLASRDWKYLALKARRDSDRPKLYLIEVATGKLSVIDEGEVEFTPTGWSNNYFVYTLYRDKLDIWQPKRTAIKSFNAQNRSLTVLDESAAVGSDASKYAFESIDFVYILRNEIVFAKDWRNGPVDFVGDGSKSITFNSVKPDGSNKKVVKSFPDTALTYIGNAKLYKPEELYFFVAQNDKRTYWEYENGSVIEKKDLSEDDFYKSYPTFLVSPSGKSTFWAESRDGKNTLFVGDSEGNNAKEVASLSEYTAYGWQSDDYLLLSKGGSELYILALSDLSAKPLKITDYHKPQTNFAGYGYGYGGL